MNAGYAGRRAYMDRLTETLASDSFAEPDDQLPGVLRKMAQEQVKLRKFRAAIQLRRAAQLIEAIVGAATDASPSRR